MGKTQQKGASLNPETFSAGGGLLDDVTVEIKSCTFEMYDYGGASPAAPGLVLIMQPVDGGEEVDQFFSAGNAKDWEPSKDGSRLIPTDPERSKSFNKGSNLGILIRSIVEAGFPPDQMDDDVTVFEGMVAHMVRVPAPKRSGLNRSPRADGKKYEDMNLVVDNIISLPGEAASADGGSDDSKPGVDSDFESMAEGVVMEALADSEKEGVTKVKSKVTKKELMSLGFKVIKADDELKDHRNDIVKLLILDDFLGHEDRVWTFNPKSGGSVSLG